MTKFSTLAAVDLGSNSFNLQIARVVSDQIYPLDSIRDPVAIAAGLSKDKKLTSDSQEKALDSLKRFGERLRGMDKNAVRAIGTNTLRVAKNAEDFLKKAETALGFPIEIISGREEARLIYIGVAHSVPASEENRLVIDIGGGSTELIIGNRLKPVTLESLFMGCVSYSRLFFPNGKITKLSFEKAQLAASLELQGTLEQFGPEKWGQAIGSSGTLGALAKVAKVMTKNSEVITIEILREIKQKLLEAKHWNSINIEGLREDRREYLPGGLAITIALMENLKISELVTTKGAIREGILYDLLGRFRKQDIREVTIENYKQHYHIDRSQAHREHELTKQFTKEIFDSQIQIIKDDLKVLLWAAQLHEIGFSIGYSGYHRHGAYILENAEMPGFSTSEQKKLAAFVKSHRRSLDKSFSLDNPDLDWRLILALRLATLFYRKRAALQKPNLKLSSKNNAAILFVDKQWLQRNPLTKLALEEESENWNRLGIMLSVQIQ